MRVHAVSRTISSRNADSFRLYLKAHAAFVFPQRSCHAGLHACGSNLASRIVHLRGVTWGTNTISMLRRSPWWHRCSVLVVAIQHFIVGAAYLATAAFLDSSETPSEAVLDVRFPEEK